MNKFYSIVGWLFIVLSILVPIVMILLQLKGPNLENVLYDLVVEAVIPGLLVFIIGFFPGRYCLKVARQSSITPLNKFATILSAIVAAISIVMVIVSSLLQGNIRENASWLTLFYLLFVAAPLYGICLILFIIDFVRQRSRTRMIGE